MKTFENCKKMHLLEAVRSGAVMIYPADTIWGIGGNAHDAGLIERIRRIKRRPLEKGFIVLVSNLNMLEQITGPVPQAVVEYMTKSVVPTTVIFPHFKGLPPGAGAPDGSLAVRWIKRGFTHNLMEITGIPLISTSANISGKPAPRYPAEMESDILNQADYIVNLHPRKIYGKPSRIVKWHPDGRWELIRA